MIFSLSKLLGLMEQPQINVMIKYGYTSYYSRRNHTLQTH